jgi:hypothetical protein
MSIETWAAMASLADDYRAKSQLAKFKQADNGKRRTTQVLQLDIAEQFQALAL